MICSSGPGIITVIFRDRPQRNTTGFLMPGMTG
jgi:hypothetical protein